MIGEKHAEDIRRSIRLAKRLGQHRVVTMSGLPGGEPGGQRSNWIVNAWNSAALDVLDYQWVSSQPTSGRRPTALAADHDVKVALELHPQNIVFNTADVRKLVELHRRDPRRRRTGRLAPVLAADGSGRRGPRTRPAGVPGRREGRPHQHRQRRALRCPRQQLPPSSPRTKPRTNLGGDEWANEWPKDSAWDFVALGRGHDTAYWTEFLRALYEVDPDMLVNIEHEDVSLGRIEGLQVAAGVLRDAARRAGIRTGETG